MKRPIGIGSRVVYKRYGASPVSGEVIGFDPDGNPIVAFDDKNLIPPIMACDIFGLEIESFLPIGSGSVEETPTCGCGAVSVYGEVAKTAKEYHDHWCNLGSYLSKRGQV